MELPLDYISKCQYITEIGSGTFGRVVLYNTPHGKMVMKQPVEDAQRRNIGYPEDFIAEIDTLAKFAPIPTIVNMKGVLFDPNKKFAAILMEALDNDLHKWYTDRTFFERISVLPTLISNIGSALWVMHSHRWIHNDIKYNNIAITNTPQGYTFKLIDFGKSRWVTPEIKEYASIERYRCPQNSNVYFSEVYAFCIVLTELIMGKSMIRSKNIQEFYDKYGSRHHLLDIRKFLYKQLSLHEYHSIPACYWDFVGPIFEGSCDHGQSTLDILMPKAGFPFTTQHYTVKDMVGNNIRSKIVVYPKMSDVIKSKLSHAYDMIKMAKASYADRNIGLFDRLMARVLTNHNGKLEATTLQIYIEACLSIILRRYYSRITYSVKNIDQLIYYQYKVLKLTEYQCFIPM
jgi:serine/threonine protein kinase